MRWGFKFCRDASEIRSTDLLLTLKLFVDRFADPNRFPDGTFHPLVLGLLGYFAGSGAVSVKVRRHLTDDSFSLR
jgi:hypothetical protein